ncbi:3-oxoacid CoA-transferase subunit B [Mycobacterium sp. UM_Kg1]|uniref:3-oxoacid CoA-transferase subunit B n=1 Tax=Mycobacterium sp. UM_Kg1 TaxID=1545691 RepID=UPI00061B4127|nr:3-oxoacid CoA-transferase subunit B [Mycobacterium sp. UM_Kg1]
MNPPLTAAVEHPNRGPLSRDELAAVIARDIPAGSYVNLGIGQPTLVADHLSAADAVILHTENGMLGMGPAARDGDIDPDLTNAGKIPVTEMPGAAYFHHADSFAMMRGGHLDVCVLGALQVSRHGDLANWHTGEPGAIPAVGGAMDLAIGAKDVFVMMDLFTKDGAAKLVESCTYPLTGLRCVSRVYTDCAVIDIDTAAGTLRARETFGTTVADLAARLAVDLGA